MLAPCAVVQIAGLRSARRNRNRPWASGADEIELTPKDVAVAVIMRIKRKTPLCGTERWQGGLRRKGVAGFSNCHGGGPSPGRSRSPCVVEDLIKRISRKARQTKSAEEAGDTERRGARGNAD